jgi:NAD(P)H dehydrogenase (quinone)
MILITGATGKAGGEVANQLAAAGVPYRALIRNPAKNAAIKALGAKVVIGDIADESILQRAFEGVEKAFLVLPNDEDQPILEKGFTDAAVAAGVEHLVYLSSLESVPESTNPITQNHVAIENYIRESGLTWTMIRPTFFMQMFEGMAPRIKETGRIVMPAGNGTVSATDLRDVGEVIVDVLTCNSGDHANQSYDLTGPELLTFAEIADRFSTVLGTRIEYVDQPIDEFRQVLKSIKLSDWRVDAVCLELEAIAAGAIDHTTDTIEALLGRPANSLTRFIEERRALFT